jgi:hypothetical protein
LIQFSRKFTDFFYVYFAEEMSTIAANLRKSKTAKEKRQAAMLGSSSTAVPSPGGDDMDNARGNAVVVDLEDTVTNANNQPHPTKVARVDQVNTSATGRVPPASPKFVLPSAIGSPELVRKSLVALSDAQQAIMSDMSPEALKNELADAMVATFKLMVESASIWRRGMRRGRRPFSPTKGWSKPRSTMLPTRKSTNSK